MIPSNVTLGKENLYMNTDVVSLVSRDSRLSVFARTKFPHSPEFVEWLVEEIRACNGSLDVLSILCKGIEDLRGHFQPVGPITKEVIDGWRSPLVSQEVGVLRIKLLDHYERLDFVGIMVLFRMELHLSAEIKSGGVEVSAEPRISVDQSQSVAYIHLFFRLLAILAQIDRPSFH